jgi:hypothetical protein
VQCNKTSPSPAASKTLDLYPRQKVIAVLVLSTSLGAASVKGHFEYWLPTLIYANAP